ncbi:dinucleotide-utilizing enzyme [Microbacterium sp. JZ31]|uniref:dinucleotide-utilizing enzyme n=1 Tax=Microbacterium sp. JZ31 TaxID=1906274 RepID=UPI001931773E|nr:dinucleotide-utilizing enzyme [Microbacterium sp. JZ31]
MSHAQPRPIRRPRLVRSIPFWLLLLGSIASLAAGILLTVPNIALMATTLLDGTATGIEVYAGQAWVTLGAAFAGAGVLGLLIALALAAAASLLPRPAGAVESPAAPVEASGDEPSRDEVPAGATA